jgi:sugar phosphate isomerase/epimerase
MQLVLFSKMLRDKSVADLIAFAHEQGLEGYDLCVRPEYPVNPDNAAEALPDAVRRMREAGLSVPMVTGNFDLLTPDHPTAEPLLRAMDRADVRRLKLGYFGFDPHKQEYAQEVEKVRRAFAGWEPLARRHNVRVCYHTHSERCLGLNAAALLHLLQGFDPRALGAYLDTGHLVAEGEEFAVAVGMVKPYLAIVGLKDVVKARVERNGHGAYQLDWVPAGQGMVDWTAVFTELARVGFDGPLSVHCEFPTTEASFDTAIGREVRFLKSMRDGVVKDGVS